MFVPIAILLISLASGAENSPLCKDENHCPDITPMFSQMLQPGLEEYLQQNCSYLLEAIQCHLNFKEKCSQTEEKFEYKILAGYFSVFSVVCDKDAPLRKALFRNLECYKRNLNVQVECEDERFKTLLNFVLYDKNITALTEDSFLNSKYLCLYTALRRYCVVGKMEKNCGNEAAIGANELLYLLEKRSCPGEMTVIWLDELIAYLWNNLNKS